VLHSGAHGHFRHSRCRYWQHVLACVAALGAAVRCVDMRSSSEITASCSSRSPQAGAARGTIAAAAGAVWGCHFGLRTVPVAQFDALQGRARLLAAADDLLASAQVFGPADAWLMPQTIQAAQQMEQQAAAAVATGDADFKSLLERIAKSSVELDSLNGLEDAERSGECAAPNAVPALATLSRSLHSCCREEAAALRFLFAGVAASGSFASALVTCDASENKDTACCPRHVHPLSHTPPALRRAAAASHRAINATKKGLIHLAHCAALPCVGAAEARL